MVEIQFVEIENLIGKTLSALNGVSWPLVVLVLAAYYRQQILLLVTALVNASSRVTRIAGIELQNETGQENEIETDSETASEMAIGDVLEGDETLLPYMQAMERHVEQFTANEAKVRLLRAWAFSERLRLFDRISALVFSTQLKALQRLTIGRADRRGLRRFYYQHVSLATVFGVPGDKILDFPRWMAFLTDNGLATKDQANYEISALGRAYIQHVNANGVTGRADL